MYSITDNSAAIKEVQGYLYQLHRAEPQKYRRVYIDGVYSDETALAVEEFQRMKAIESTGVVDYETFSLLYEEYLSISPSPESGSNKRNSLGVGDSGSEVEYLNLLLYDLSEYYVDMPPPRRSRYFSEETLESVDYMRSTFMLAQGGNVDRKLIERLENELLSRRRISL